MRVLVTFAVDAEFAPWRKLRNLESIEIEGQQIYRAQIEKAAVDFVVTGMGIENARRVTELVLNDGYQFCISSGFAGALRHEFKLGDILAASAVQSLGKSKTLESSRNLFRRARDYGAKPANLFLTSESVVRTMKEKSDLAPFAEAVEMESFGIFEVASRKEIPAIAIRAISDTARSELPAGVNTMVDNRGRVDLVGTICFIARSPQEISKLIRLGRDTRTVARGLANFLEGFIKQLSLYAHEWSPEGEELKKVAAR
jgi:adenosylhomocysteine nucleosidase